MVAPAVVVVVVGPAGAVVQEGAPWCVGAVAAQRGVDVWKAVALDALPVLCLVVL